MRIPVDAIIPREKLTEYLLVPKPKNDKSGFLKKAGFTLENPDILEDAIRRLISENEAYLEREDQYGQFYRVEGKLKGPNGILPTITVWIERAIDGEFRFVTLKPSRRGR